MMPRILDPLVMMEIHRKKAEDNLIMAAEKMRLAVDSIEKIQQLQELMREQRRRGFLGNLR